MANSKRTLLLAGVVIVVLAAGAYAYMQSNAVEGAPMSGTVADDVGNAGGGGGGRSDGPNASGGGRTDTGGTAGGGEPGPGDGGGGRSDGPGAGGG